MNPEQFSRIEFLFNAAIVLPEAQWQAFLTGQEPDADLRSAVLRLLGHARTDGQRAGPIGERLSKVFPGLGGGRPEWIGPYRLLGTLGEGGMGAVYLAERDLAGVSQKVALKLLHGVPGADRRRRMARERKLLAGLNHPRIAGLIDGGETADGQPYLVMEYIEGETLLDYLQARRPSLVDRLRLFVQCCEAVQHAHQRLILHRDIKPSNIIVTADGTAVLLDFGVGVLLDDEAQSPGTTLAFTPGYAAPEQLRGEPTTTATDVFGLGILLFDLLADARLCSLRKGDTPVPAPSACARDAALRRMLAGDLDRIVLKAAAEFPAQRYASAGALADDVQRYLRREPIAAGPDRFVYRAGKFLARHRWATAAVGAVLTMALVFVWRLDGERQRALQAQAEARREAANARASRDFVMSVLAAADPEQARGQPLTAAALLSASAARLRADRGQDPQTRALAWLTLAEVYASINDPSAGLKALDEANAALPGGGAFEAARARVLEARGTLLTQAERYDEAAATLGQLVRMREQAPDDALGLARAHRALAGVAAETGDAASAQRHLDLALQRLASPRGEDAGRLRLRVLLDLVELHWRSPGDTRADGYLQRALFAARADLRAEDPQWRDVHRAEASVHRSKARYALAREASERALAVSLRSYGQDSQHTADSESDLAMVLGRLGRYREAVEHLRRAREILARLALEPRLLAQQDILLAVLYEGRGDCAGAIELLDRALAVLPRDDPAYASWRWIAYKQRASSYGELRRFDRAWADFDRAQGMAQAAHGVESVEYSQILVRRALVLVDAGRGGEAAELARRARHTGESRGAAAYAPIWVRQAELEARIAAARGDSGQARRQIERALELSLRDRDSDPVKLAKLRLVAAEMADAQGQSERARELLDQSWTVLQAELSAQAPQLARAQRLRQRLAAVRG